MQFIQRGITSFFLTLFVLSSYHSDKIYFLFVNLTFLLGIYELFLFIKFYLHFNNFRNQNRKIYFLIVMYQSMMIYIYFSLLFKMNQKQRYLDLILYNSTSDVFQFLCGKIFGHYYLTNITTKTLEGYAGGIIFPRILFPDFDENLIYYNLIGMMGGLFSSYLKRKLGVKHWSNLLGAHGGVGDRLDSLVIPLFFYNCYNFKF